MCNLKKGKYPETESRVVVTRSGMLGEMERYPSMGTKLWSHRMNKSIDLH